jgi:hypothetical protein
MDLSEYDSIIRSLVAIAARQDVTNRRLEETMQDVRAILQQQAAINTQQAVVNTQNTTLILRIVRTLDLIDEKLGQLLHP